MDNETDVKVCGGPGYRPGILPGNPGIYTTNSPGAGVLVLLTLPGGKDPIMQGGQK